MGLSNVDLIREELRAVTIERAKTEAFHPRTARDLEDDWRDAIAELKEALEQAESFPAIPTPFDSMIEKLLWEALKARHETRGDWARVRGLVCQHPVGPFRLDLAYPAVKLGIECDGAQYHSSPGRIKRDSQRDAYLRSQGWRVLRFTGSRIHRAIHECVEEVYRALDA